MSDDKDDKAEKLSEGTLISHLLELRNRVVRMAISLIVAFVPCAAFSKKLFHVLAVPLLKQLRAGESLIATSVVSAFTAPLKLALYVALGIAMPYILSQIWGFVAPGLYKKEKRFAVPLLVSSIVLFYVGVAFAYFVVLPRAFQFFVSYASPDVKVTPDINLYLDLALGWFLAFGIAFEVPVVVVLLVATGLVSVEKLSTSRGYVIIGIFAAAAVLTPPDPWSQIAMAIPMWMLFEAGLLFARIVTRKPKAGDSPQDTDASKK